MGSGFSVRFSVVKLSDSEPSLVSITVAQVVVLVAKLSVPSSTFIGIPRAYKIGVPPGLISNTGVQLPFVVSVRGEECIGCGDVCSSFLSVAQLLMVRFSSCGVRSLFSLGLCKAES